MNTTHKIYYSSDSILEGEDAWDAHFKARENALKDVFGEEHPPGSVWPGNMPLIAQCPGASVLKFPPTEDRQAWHFVSNGLAQPNQGGENQLSSQKACGLGREFVLSSLSDGEWQARILLNLMEWVAVNKLNILANQTIGIGDPIVPDGNPALTVLISFINPANITRLVLPGGNCDLIHLMAVTQDEVAYAQDHSDSKMHAIQTLSSLSVLNNPYGPITDGDRQCSTKTPNFPTLWQNASQAPAHR